MSLCQFCYVVMSLVWTRLNYSCCYVVNMSLCLYVHTINITTFLCRLWRCRYVASVNQALQSDQLQQFKAFLRRHKEKTNLFFMSLCQFCYVVMSLVWTRLNYSCCYVVNMSLCLYVHTINITTFLCRLWRCRYVASVNQALQSDQLQQFKAFLRRSLLSLQRHNRNSYELNMRLTERVYRQIVFIHLWGSEWGVYVSVVG